MARDTPSELFPPVSAVHAKSQNVNGAPSLSVRRRRGSSSLGAELPGDGNVGALATLSPPPSPLPSQVNLTTPSTTKTRGSKRRKVKGFFKRWRKISVRHTWLNPLIVCLIVVSIYLANPTESNPVTPALFLSYKLPQAPGETGPVHYGKGKRDFAFVAFYTIFFSFTREFLMQRLIRPLAIQAGMKSRAKQSRFMEQFYTALYFSIFGPFGMWVMSRTPVWYFNTTGMYENFPHFTHDGPFKAYYLLQASYWAQQMIVMMLLLEKPRKDFKELVVHHIITLLLIGLSYRFHFTYMGLAVYITHDISDFFLATSKILNYIDSIFIAPFFFTFVFAWGYLRHYINLRILYSIATEFETVGPFELNWDTQQYKCRLSQVITFGLLAALQAVNIFWFFLILRIGYRFVVSWGEDVKDDRSEYEESEVEETGDATPALEKSEAVLLEKTNGMAHKSFESQKGADEVQKRRSPRKKQ